MSIIQDIQNRALDEGRIKAENVCLVRKKCVQCVPVCLGVDGNRLDPHLPACPDDPNGDLAAVCD